MSRCGNFNPSAYMNFIKKSQCIQLQNNTVPVKLDDSINKNNIDVQYASELKHTYFTDTSDKFYDIPEILENDLKEIDVNIKSNYGETLLMACCHNKRDDLVKYILDRCADPNIQDYCGCTVLIDVCSEITGIKFEYIDILLDNGADPNLKTKYGNTALMCLCRHRIDHINHDTFIRLIISTNTQIINTENETAYDIYVKFGNTVLTTEEEYILRGESISNIIKSAKLK